MNIQQEQEHFDAFTQKMHQVLMGKGDDYANSDRLSNFKVVGNICGISAEMSCLTLVATKVARLGVLLHSKKAPNNESIRDSVLDLANYAVLLDMILTEKEGLIK